MYLYLFLTESHFGVLCVCMYVCVLKLRPYDLFEGHLNGSVREAWDSWSQRVSSSPCIEII